MKSLFRHDPAIPAQDIAVLTPYSAQKSKLMERVKKETGKLRDIVVASVTESQGQVKVRSLMWLH